MYRSVIIVALGFLFFANGIHHIVDHDSVWGTFYVIVGLTLATAEFRVHYQQRRRHR